MKSDKIVISVDQFEHDLLLNGFNEFRNTLIENDEPTEDVDLLLTKLLDAPTLREKRHADRETR